MKTRKEIEAERKRHLENPIWYKDGSLKRPRSILIEELRDDLTAVRGKLRDISRAYGCGDRLDPMNGLITCGLSYLYDAIIEFHNREMDEAKIAGGLEFRSRGIGMDMTPGCFVCGGTRGTRSNISGFVESKEAGEMIVKMFESGAWLDYRPSETSWIQVNIGCCDNHIKNLQLLDRLTDEASQTISKEMVKKAMEYNGT